MYGNVIYFANINSIGGCESFFYYLAKKYNKYDTTIMYKNGDPAQIKRLRELVRVQQFKGQHFKCKKLFVNYNYEILDYVDAKEKIDIIHYVPDENDKPILDSRIDKHLGVSKLVCRKFEEITGEKCELAYNPVEIDKPRKVLTLVSATRLTWEKGKKRYLRLIEALEQNNIPYIWYIFTDDVYKDTKKIENPNIVYKKPDLHVIDYMAIADYVVSLSDKESFGIMLNESLKIGTPIICTDIEILKELGIKNGVHGYIVDLDMNNIPIQDIYNKIPKGFKYDSPKDTWDKLLDHTKSKYQKECKQKQKVRFIRSIYYVPFQIEYKRGQEYMLENKVIDELLEYGDIELVR